jgi:hypothetical protein
VPSLNLVENLGFGPDATHTTGNAPHLRVPAGKLSVTRHPAHVRRSRTRDDIMFRAYTGEKLTWKSDFAGRLRVLHRQLLGIGDSSLPAATGGRSADQLPENELTV